jgi:chemotaxis signal transduction protein
MTAGAVATSTETLTGVQAGGQYWLCDCAHMLIEEVPPIAPVPLARRWFRGLVALEGRLRGVVDLSVLTGGVCTPITHESRLVRPISETADEDRIAILVGSVVGERAVRDLDPFPELPTDGSWDGPSVFDPRGRAWKLINIDALVRHPDLLDICA